MTRRKELHFFCSCPNPRLRAADDLSEYRRLFGEAKVVGESSPCYLYYQDIPAKIIAAFPAARILVSLRDPVQRFWSHYLMNEAYRSRGMSPEAVLDEYSTDGPRDAIHDLFGVGLYGEQLSRWQSVFEPARIKVVFLEDMTTNPNAVLTDIFEFVSVGPALINTAIRDKEYVEPRGVVGRVALRRPSTRRIGNIVLPAAVRRALRTRVLGDASRKPLLPPTLEQRLKSMYREDSQRLEGLLEVALPWTWHRE